jgi:polyhydroxyalkanoate synthesis regulator protein
MENNIRIIRLKNNNDIIANMEFRDSFVILYDPLLMSVQHFRGNQGQLVLLNYLPHSLITENIATIDVNEILLTMNPNDEMVDHYLDTVEQSKSLQVKGVEELTDEEMSNMMEVMDEINRAGKNLIIH